MSANQELEHALAEANGEVTSLQLSQFEAETPICRLSEQGERLMSKQKGCLSCPSYYWRSNLHSIEGFDPCGGPRFDPGALMESGEIEDSSHIDMSVRTRDVDGWKAVLFDTPLLSLLCRDITDDDFVEFVDCARRAEIEFTGELMVSDALYECENVYFSNHVIPKGLVKPLPDAHELGDSDWALPLLLNLASNRSMSNSKLATESDAREANYIFPCWSKVTEKALHLSLLDVVRSALGAGVVAEYRTAGRAGAATWMTEGNTADGEGGDAA
ncbi:hypothetical protein ACLOJK_032361 [Asimina triloba]